MELKEKIKKEIDTIPDEYLPQLERYPELIKRGKKNERRVKTIHLKGKFDNLNIRKLVYE